VLLFASVVGKPGVGLKYPRKHSLQTSALVALTALDDVPAGQGLQLTAFVNDENVPAAQGKHEDEPDLSE
jgi:hypothetical protein